MKNALANKILFIAIAEAVLVDAGRQWVKPQRDEQLVGWGLSRRNLPPMLK